MLGVEGLWKRLRSGDGRTLAPAPKPVPVEHKKVLKTVKVAFDNTLWVKSSSGSRK